MRIIFPTFISAFIVVSLFYLIIGLIHQDYPTLEIEEESVQVNIENVTKEAPEQEAKSKKREVLEPEPTLISEIKPSLNQSLINPDQPLIKLSVEQTEFKFQSEDIPKLQENWVQPSANPIDAKTLGEQIGSNPKTLRKIIPVSTRKPLVPKIAWENRIDGWVLLSFEVTSEGKTENIQVLDSYPRGIFEDEAVAAANRWIYLPIEGPNSRLSQKIEFQWKDYPYNWE